MTDVVLWLVAIVSAALFAAFLYAAVAGNRAQDRLVEEQRRRQRGGGPRG